jgi:hypothetical protein
VGHEAAFEAFKDSVSHEDLVATAHEVLKSVNLPSKIQEDTISRLNKFALTEFGKQLIFNYKVVFESQLESLKAPANSAEDLVQLPEAALTSGCR